MITRSRLTPDAMDPALYLLLLDLSLATCYDERAYLEWACANAMTLDFDFALTGLDIDAYGGWAREQFVNRSNAVVA